MTGLALLKGFWRIASICVPVPLALIAAGWLWVHFDKASSVRRAVDRVTVKLVAGAEIAALQARIDAQARIAAFERQRAADLHQANNQLEAALAAEAGQGKLDDELQALAAKPAPDRCLVDDGLYGRLRNR